MTASPPFVPGEEDIGAYVDGELPAERRVQMDAFLAEHPDAAAQVRDYVRQNELLHVLFDPVLTEPIPERLPSAPSRRDFRPLARLAAAIVYLLIGGAGGWLLHEWNTRQDTRTAQLPADAAVAHVVYTPEVRHPVEVTADQQTHLVAWLTKRLGVTVRAPVLSGEGYELMGGRLLPSDRGPAAHFMYQDSSGERLTLYLRATPDNKEVAAFRFTHDDGVGVFYWIDRGVGYALAGQLERERLLAVANTIYRQLNP
jgi:anti-sigma factor RsiW